MLGVGVSWLESGVLIVVALLAQLPGSLRGLWVLNVRLLLDLGLILLALLAQLPGSLRGLWVLDVRPLLDLGLLLLSGARLLLGVRVQVRVDVGLPLLGLGGRWSRGTPQGRTHPHMGMRVSRRGRVGASRVRIMVRIRKWEV